jgi:hypothetical protein
MILDLLRGILRGDNRRIALRLLQHYQEKGRMLRVSVDSENKRLEIEVQLRDQPEPLRLTADHYEVVSEAEGRFLLLQGLETSWNWVNRPMRLLGLNERKVPLPAQYADLIELAL